MSGNELLRRAVADWTASRDSALRAVEENLARLKNTQARDIDGLGQIERWAADLHIAAERAGNYTRLLETVELETGEAQPS